MNPEKPVHYKAFVRGPEFYPFERIGSWASDSNGLVYPIAELNASIGDSKLIDEAGKEVRLGDFLRANGINTDELIPIGTYGSNASPRVLNKFDGKGLPLSVLTLKGKIKNRDCVYEARTAQLGHVPFTLASSEGTETDFYINILTPEQTKRMHVTEGCRKEEPRTYELGIYEEVILDTASPVWLPANYIYVATGHVFIEDGKPVAPASESYTGIDKEGRSLKAGNDFVPVKAVNRRFTERCQIEIMELLDSYVTEKFGQPLYMLESKLGEHAYRINPILDVKNGEEAKKLFERVKQTMQQEKGRKQPIDVDTVPDPWNIGGLKRFRL